jgi:isopentenyl-diphosphate delta-isomerase
MSFAQNEVILVDEKDTFMGTMEKMEAHRRGLLHRAFSIFILNEKNEMLIQQRADTKYHSAGLWSNACCSHPIPGEETLPGAERRLNEELGFITPLEHMFILRYHAEVGNDLIENEFDHIYLGHYDGVPKINASEVKAYKFIPLDDLQLWMDSSPQLFTYWFQIAMPDFRRHFRRDFQPA